MIEDKSGTFYVGGFVQLALSLLYAGIYTNRVLYSNWNF